MDTSPTMTFALDPSFRSMQKPPECTWEGFSRAREIVKEQYPNSVDETLEIIKKKVSEVAFYNNPSDYIDKWAEVAERRGERLACRIVVHVHYSRWNRMGDAAKLAERWCGRRDSEKNPVYVIQEIYRRTSKQEFHQNPDLALRMWKAEGRAKKREGRMYLLRSFPGDLALEVIQETLHPTGWCVLL